MALIVEVLGPGDAVRERVRVDGLPLYVGRGLDNDVVLDDPYVDARHARVVRDVEGRVVVEDMGSLNGLGDTPGGGPVEVVAGTRVRLGRTWLRFRDTAEPVPPALPDHGGGPTGDVEWLERPVLRLAAIAGTTGLSALLGWLASYGDSAATDAMGGAIALLAVGAVWAGVWAIAGRAVGHRFRFGAHLAVFCAVFLAGTVWWLADDWAAFLFPDNPASSVVGTVVGFGLLAALVAMHLGVATELSTRRRWRAGGVSAAVSIAVVAAITLAEGDTFTDVPTFSSTIRPFPVTLVPATDTDGFGDAADDLREELDELLAEGEG